MLDQYKDLSLAERVGRLKAIFARRSIKATGNGKVIDSSNHYRDKSTKYIALEDFLADAIVECENLGLVPTVTFDVPGKTSLAALIMTDATGKEPPFIPWTTVPTDKASGLVEDLQAIGSQIKYTRRYLWTTFLDLVEHDALEDGVFNDEIRAVNGLIVESADEKIPQTAPEKPTCNYRQTPPKPVKEEQQFIPPNPAPQPQIPPQNENNTYQQGWQSAQQIYQYPPMNPYPEYQNESAPQQNCNGNQTYVPNSFQPAPEPVPEYIPSPEMHTQTAASAESARIPQQNQRNQSYIPPQSQPQPVVNNIYTQRPMPSQEQPAFEQRITIGKPQTPTQTPAQMQNNSQPVPGQNAQTNLSERDYLKTLPNEEIVRRRLRYMKLKNDLKNMNKEQVINLVLQLYGVTPGSQAASATVASLQVKTEDILKKRTLGIIETTISLCDQILVDSSLNKN